MTPRAPSVLSSWSRIILRALAARGVEPAPLVRAAGLVPEAFADPDARVPLAASGALWREAVAATGDPAFGLAASRFVTQTTFSALGFAVAASATLAEAFQRFARYGALVSDAATPRLVRAGERCELRFERRAGAPPPADEAMDALLALIARSAGALSGRSLAPLAVALVRAEPRPSDAWPRTLRAPVRFGAEADTLVYPSADLDAPLPAANAELARANEEVVARHLARLDQQRLSARVHAVLVERLASGEPEPAAVARGLGLSLRSLQRRLAEEGTSWKQVLAEARRELACSYLREGRTSVTELTFLLGFADTSSFARAFRRWTGLAPSAWQERERAR